MSLFIKVLTKEKKENLGHGDTQRKSDSKDGIVIVETILLKLNDYKLCLEKSLTIIAIVSFLKRNHKKEELDFKWVYSVSKKGLSLIIGDIKEIKLGFMTKKNKYVNI
ncbi:MAG: hypothetical protein WBG30_11430 [Psychrilyobacter sp.]|uniref:hypothetical protein n=1 Tax=Psychrilyobacter sp. TaxID=2586924 RepID=UPI003C78B73E